jgi:hypothetical protein
LPANVTPATSFQPGFGLGDKLSSYNQDRFFAWPDTSRLAEGQKLVKSLRQATWIDDSTKSLEAIIILFNAQLQSYGHINVKMIMERGGLVKQELEVRTLWASVFPAWYYMLPDVIWLLFVLKFIANSFQKAADNQGKGCFAKFCPDIELFLDWAGIYSL